LTVCWIPKLPELSVTVSVPVAGPATDGAKDTKTVQLVPAIKVVAQFVVSANPLLAVMLEKLSGLPPKLVMLTACGAPDDPMF